MVVADGVVEPINQQVYFFFGNGEGWRQRNGIGGCADKRAIPKGMFKNMVSAAIGAAGQGSYIYCPHKPNASDVGNAVVLAQGVELVGKVLCEGGGGLVEVFVIVNVERGLGCCAGHGVGAVGVAMKKIKGGFFLRLAGGGQRLMYLGREEHRPHRDNAVGERLCRGNHIGNNIKMGSGKGGANPSKGGDDFVKDKQDVVLAGNLS